MADLVKSTERNFSWEDVEIDAIKEKKNNLKRVRPIPAVKQKNVHAKPQQLLLDLLSGSFLIYQ